MTLQVRRDTASNWTTANPTLANGQVGYETDTRRLKIGDGSAAWTALPYFITSAKIHVGTTAPGSPAVGDLWVDTN